MMRSIGIVALALLLAGAASAASTKPTAHGPLALGAMLESHGVVDLGSAPGKGELLRFVPRGQFQLGLLLRNRSGETLVVTGARVLEPSRTLVHQIGTRFHRWRVFKCPPGAMCPAHVFPLKGGPAQPRPFSLAARKYVGVELDFQLGSCSQIPHANPAPISRLRVTFRTAAGATRHRVFPLDGAELHLRMPKLEDCADPRSSLSIGGPQQYASSNYWTIPGSTGDVCTIRNGRLYFVSRKYQTHISRPFRRSHYERVTLQMHFHGTGTYESHATIELVAAKRLVFRSHHPLVRVTKATPREVIAKVAAGRLPSGTTRGIPFRISGTLRCRVTR